MLKQISVFVENKKGRLAAMTQVLADNGIDLIALSIADTTNFGILRCIVNKVDVAVKVLEDAGFTVNTTDVIGVQVPDDPGGLAGVLKLLSDKEVSVEYLYSFVRGCQDAALILFRVNDVGKAMDIFRENGIEMVEKDQLGIE